MKEQVPTHSLEDAQWEANQMKKKIEQGEVKDYSEAEERVEKYKLEVVLARMKYNLEVAQEEANYMKKKIEQGEAKNYSDAEKIIADEQSEIIFAMMEEEGKELIAKEKLKFDTIDNDEPLSEKEFEEFDQMMKKMRTDYPRGNKDFSRVYEAMLQATRYVRTSKSNAFNRGAYKYLLDKTRDYQKTGDKNNDYLIEQSELNDILDKYLYNKK